MVELFDTLAKISQIIATVFMVVFVAGAAWGIIKMISEIVKVNIRLREANKIRQSYDVISVEAEITNIRTKRWNPMDTQYIVDLSYSIGIRTYEKQIVLHNKQSLRVGQILILLCDPEFPESVILQSGAEEASIKGLTFALIVDILIVLYGVWSMYYRFKHG